MQPASELLEEFKAITEFVCSGEDPQEVDKKNIIQLYAKIFAKIDESLLPITNEYERARRIVALSAHYEDENGKPVTVARFDDFVSKGVERQKEGITAKYYSALGMLNRLERCAVFLREYMAFMGPIKAAPVVPKKMKKTIEREEAEAAAEAANPTPPPPEKKPLEPETAREITDRSRLQEEMNPKKGEAVGFIAAKSTFQKILDSSKEEEL